MKVIPFFKIYNFDVVQKFIWPNIQELKLKTLKGFWIQSKLDFFNEISLQTWADLKSFLPSNKCTEFCKSTLHKSYNCTPYSNITAERTLHKIIITHITFYNYTKILIQTIKHMMHTINTQLLSLRWCEAKNKSKPPLEITKVSLQNLKPI